MRLTADLVRCPSVTPEEAGAIRLLESVLSDAGFTCFRADRGRVSNLVARWGPKGHPRTFGFNGHIDVVPPGDPADWSVDPFGAEVKDGFLWGRGATDMKSGVAAFVAAAADFVRRTPPDGAVIITVTGDEEGDATDGTSAILDWMEAEGERMTHCLVGEPTCPDRIGEAVKIGRRGSMNLRFKATGVQGHAAYPERAANPVPVLVALLHRLATATLDRGTGHFDASTVAITTFDTGNEASNVIPASCRAAVNIRFNDAHSSTSLRDWVAGEIAAVIEGTGVTVEVEAKVSGESFLTPPGEFSDLVGRAILAETGVTPALSTSGGTSDARFIRAHCPVVEFGLVGRTMHEVDERVEVEQIKTLTAIYGRILAEYFGV